MQDVDVIEDPQAAAATLDPIRVRLLAALVEPSSATMLAGKVGQPRQKINYHLRELEKYGLVELVEERRKGNMTERVLRATASSYVISPAAMGPVAPDPDNSPDRLSARWLLALGARLVKEVGALIRASGAAKRPLTTYAIDAEVRFASADDRAAFAAELTATVTGLVGKYHDDSAPGGREHRIIVALHPKITKDLSAKPSEATDKEPDS